MVAEADRCHGWFSVCAVVARLVAVLVALGDAAYRRCVPRCRGSTTWRAPPRFCAATGSAVAVDKGATYGAESALRDEDFTKSIFLELKTDDVQGMRQKITSFGASKGNFTQGFHVRSSEQHGRSRPSDLNFKAVLVESGQRAGPIGGVAISSRDLPRPAAPRVPLRRFTRDRARPTDQLAQFGTGPPNGLPSHHLVIDQSRCPVVSSSRGFVG
jgi:hypothetical protein